MLQSVFWSEKTRARRSSFNSFQNPGTTLINLSIRKKENKREDFGIIIFQLLKVVMLEKCVLTILELNWNEHLGHKRTKLNICHHMLTSSTQLQNKSFRGRKNENVFKMSKNENAHAKRAKLLFSIVKYTNLWGFGCRLRRGCF